MILYFGTGSLTSVAGNMISMLKRWLQICLLSSGDSTRVCNCVAEIPPETPTANFTAVFCMSQVAIPLGQRCMVLRDGIIIGDLRI